MDQLDSALGRLLVVLKIIPLRSNENFLRLQDELAGTENRIAWSGRRYNEACRITTRLLLSFRTAGGEHERIHSHDAYFKREEGARRSPR